MTLPMQRPEFIPPVLDPAAVASLLDVAGIRILDVRTPGEFETVHIPGSYNVPLYTLGEHSAEIRRSVLDPVLLVCQSGGRARQAEQALKEAGMSNLHVLDGGIAGWLGSGLGVVRGREKMSMERQVRIVAGGISAVGGILAMTVSPVFGVVSAIIGGGLVFAGVTNTCGMAYVLSWLPFNRGSGCDVPTMVKALSEGTAPTLGVREVTTPSARCCAP